MILHKVEVQLPWSDNEIMIEDHPRSTIFCEIIVLHCNKLNKIKTRYPSLLGLLLLLVSTMK